MVNFDKKQAPILDFMNKHRRAEGGGGFWPAPTPSRKFEK